MMDRFDFIVIATSHLHHVGFTIAKEDDSYKWRKELYIERLDCVLDMEKR